MMKKISISKVLHTSKVRLIIRNIYKKMTHQTASFMIITKYKTSLE